MTPEAVAVEAVGLTRIHTAGRDQVRSLDDVSINVARAEVVSVMGPSGSGARRTLLISWGARSPRCRMREDRSVPIGRRCVNPPGRRFAAEPAVYVLWSGAFLLLQATTWRMWRPSASSAVSRRGCGIARAMEALAQD